MSAVAELRRRWSTFWFGELDARPVALLRIGVGTIVTWMLLERLSVARTVLSDDGWFPHEAAVHLMDPWHWSLLHPFGAPWQVTTVLVLGGLGALAFTLGLYTRLGGAVAFVALASVHTRNPAVLYGADSVARVWLAYLLLMPCGRAWSVDAIRHRLRDHDAAFGSPAPTLPAWPVRLFQIQVATVYLTTGISKAYGTDYHDGTALWHALSNPVYSRWLDVAEPLYAAGGSVLAALTVMTLWWELAFAFMVPFRRLRPIALGLGVFVHGGIFVLMDIEWWGPLMLLSYLAFVDPRRLHGLWLRQVRETRERWWDRRMTLTFDPADTTARGFADRVAALDVYGLVQLRPDPTQEGRRLVRRHDGYEVPVAEHAGSIGAVLPRWARPWLRGS